MTNPIDDLLNEALGHLHAVVEGRARKPVIVKALWGAADGTTDVPGRANYVYVRLYGDNSQGVPAVNPGLSLSAGTVVEVEVERRNDRIIGYVVLGLPRDGTSATSTYYGAGVPVHDHPPGNANIRSLTALRAQPQSTPDMTLAVARGWYELAGLRYYAGGNSPAFVANQNRLDVLVIDAAGTLSILNGPDLGGGGAGGFGGVTYPTPVIPTDLPAIADTLLPIAIVYVRIGMGVIAETDIWDDPRPFLTAGTATSTPGGTDKNVQYNDAGAFGGVTNNATATKKYLQQVSDGTPDFQQVDYADLSGTPAAGASTGDAFVTIGHPSDLTAERNLAAGQGITINDGGANGDVTLALTPLTGALAADGAWDFIQDPRAVYYNGRTYIGYVKSNGDIAVRYFDHATRTVSAETVLHAALEVDTHDSPCILVRDSDHRLLVFYTKHSGTVLYERVSTNPEDISAFGAETDLAGTLGGPEFTYASAIQLTGEANSPIYLFWRAYIAASSSQAWWYSKSTDGGATWAARTELEVTTGRSGYVKPVQNGTTRIDFAMTDGSPVSDSAVSVYHFYYTGGSFYKSDGTSAGSLPLTTANMTLVYDGTTKSTWIINDVAVDASTARPLIAFAKLQTSTDHRYEYARWTGSAWSVSEIVAEGGQWDSETGGQYAAAGIVIDPLDTRIVYLCKKVSSQWEVYQYWTIDGGTDWQNVAITTGSANVNIFPVCPRNAARDLRVLWLYGTYTTYTNYNLGIYGYGSLRADEKVKVTGNDAVPKYLKDKLVAGSNITLTEGDDGGDETLTLAATGVALSTNAPQDVGSADSAGSGTAASKDDHIHKGVHSISVNGGAAQVGDVALSIDGGHEHVLDRFAASTAQTVFDLSAYAYQVELCADNGSLIDPDTYTLAADGSQVTMDSGITAGHVVTVNYIARTL